MFLAPDTSSSPGLFDDFDSPGTDHKDGDILASHHPLFASRTLSVPDRATMLAALQTDAVARRILAKNQTPEPSEVVGIRLNINVLKHTGVAVHSIHKRTSLDGYRKGRGLFRGEVISFQPVVVLRGAYFNVAQSDREAIASGRSAKKPMASIDGEFVPLQGTPDFSGIEVSFNPRDTHLFVDAEGGAIQYAEECTTLGHRAYCRGLLKYFTAQTWPSQAGTSPSRARISSAITGQTST